MLLAVVLISGSAVLGAQSNRVIDGLIEEEQASFGRVLYLVQTAAGLIDEETAPEQAVRNFEFRTWNLQEKRAEQPISLGEYSQLLVQAFGIKGGIMYRLFPGPRYAAREMEYLGFIRGSGAPARHLSGREVLDILRELLAWKGESA
jgi:hypothetical protein